MGNKLGMRRQVVDDKYTRLQGLYEHKDVDHKKLRKLILDSKLAPCYPGDEEFAVDLEECPICFLYYPSLNCSKCCMKGICTECFLQIKPPHSTRPTQCPFCKTSNYGVDYRGLRSKEEKGMEQLEDQKVIEAKIRMRQQELLDEEQRMLKKQEMSSSSGRRTPSDAECRDITSSSVAVPSLSLARQSEDIVLSEDLCVAPTISRPPHLVQRREGNFDLDLEDIMVMEAIWLSIQECGSCRNMDLLNHNFAPMGQSESSPSAGLACTIAALAERQHIDVNFSAAMPALGMLDTSSSMSSSHISHGNEMEAVNYLTGNWIDVAADSERTLTTRPESEWAVDHASEVAEAGTSYASSNGTPEGGGRLQSNHTDGDQLHLPESFDEQMMVAMAVSLAEARARPSPQEMTWL